jgi:hypothetical protein
MPPSHCASAAIATRGWMSSPARATSFQERTLDLDKTFVDLLLGGRYAWRPSERWGITLRADGSLGQTEGTWSTSLMADYRTGNGAWLFGYRYLEGKFGNGNLDATLNLSGPTFGYGFRF